MTADGVANNVVATIICGIGGAVLAALWAASRLAPADVLRLAFPWGVIAVLLVVVLALCVVLFRGRRRPGATEPDQVTESATEHAQADELGWGDVILPIGRDDLRAGVRAFVYGRDRTVLTLWGRGGIGKTAVARSARDDATRFVEVPLVAAHDHGDFVVQVAARLGVRPEKQAVDSAVSNAIALLDDRVVLVLDSFEHLPAECAQTVARWAAANNRVRIVVTSQAKLGLPAERPLEVPPLAENDAVTLFVRAAARRAPSFVATEATLKTVAKICRKLDCVPQMVLLAAGFADTQSLDEIKAGIGDIDYLHSPVPAERHRSLRAMTARSMSLLDDIEHRVLAQVSVIAGPFDLAAATAVVELADGPPDESKILHALQSLHSRTLVARIAEASSSRFQLRPEVRKLGLETLADGMHGTASDVEARCARFFIARAERATADLETDRVRQGLHQLASDYDTLLDIVRRSIDHLPDVAARAAVPLARYIALEKPGEHRAPTLQRIDEALTPHADPTGELRARVRIELARAHLDLVAARASSLTTALAWAEAATVVLGESPAGVDAGRAAALRAFILGRRRTRGDEEETRRQSERAEQLFLAAERADLAAEELAERASRLDARDRGPTLAAARARFTGCVGLLVEFRLLGAEFGQAMSVQDISAAEHIVGRQREVAAAVGTYGTTYRARYNEACVLSERGDHAAAAAVFDELGELFRRAGDVGNSVECNNARASSFLRMTEPSTDQLAQSLASLDEAIHGAGLIEGYPPASLAVMQINRAWTLHRLGRHSEARDSMRLLSPRIPLIVAESAVNGVISLTMRARIYEASGAHTEAAHSVRDARRLSDEHGFRTAEAGTELRDHLLWLESYGEGGAVEGHRAPADS